MQPLRSVLENQKIVRVEGVNSTQLAYMVAREEFKGTTLWVVESEREQLSLAQDLGTFTDFRAAIFPDMPHLPWDGAGADPVLTGERLAIRASILENENPKHIIVTARSLLSRWVSESEFRESYSTFGIGDTVERNAIVDTLMVCSHQRVDTVEDPGTFAVRGSIIDCFVPLQTHQVALISSAMRSTIHLSNRDAAAR